ncbi:MAG: DNA-directed RNA polymerase subunit B [Candidatus Diapherotrites archaeon]|nr:DNA-directed RNA polymerase subunit B [Candidatus Diapherotrites archaeon]
MASVSKAVKVYINGRLIGFHDSPQKLKEELITARRTSQINPLANIAYHSDTNELYINTDAGRVQRPVIVVENGKPKLTEEHKKSLREGKLTWEELQKQGVIEYIDSEEEENLSIALSKEDVTSKHTHMEINPLLTLSVISSMIPYLQHNMAGKVLHGAKMFKQAIGINGINYNLRTDTEGFLLHYPQKELVQCETHRLIEMDSRPQSQNFVVAIMPFYGFNTLDALVLNKGALDRALGRNSYFRTYEGVENRYPGGQKDKFMIPTEETIGYLQEDLYKNLGEDGLVELESYLNEKDIVMGRTSPPRFLEEISEFGVVKEKRRESSITTRKGKAGHVDKVLLTENEDSNKLAKIKVRSTMIPEIGDKLSSRHGQKGVIGAIFPEADMPFTAEGLKPDLILNPHSIPSRMTMGHLLEMIAGKAGALAGQDIDGTPFNSRPLQELEEMLKKQGFRADGNETFYDGTTGKRIEGQVFTGVCSYRRLFHLVAHKMQARARGPVQILTRQPTEGKEKEGGLRFGEMEGETLVGHGAAMLLHEKFIEDSDKVSELVCEKCGVIAINDRIRNKKYCPICESSAVYPVEMSYGFKLLLEELKALGIMPKLNIKDKV